MKHPFTLCAMVLATVVATQAQAVEIQVGYAYSATFDPTFERMMQGFSKAHPDIQVTFRATYENYEDATNTVLREAVANTLPDVSFQALNRQALLVERGIAKPLDPYIAREADFETDGYHKAMLDLSTFDGAIYGLPFSVSTPISFYNMDILRAAGVETLPSTWDEVIAACNRIKVNTDKEPLYWEWNISGNWLLQAAMWSQGVPMIKDGKLNMDNPEGLKALETAKAIFQDCGMKNVVGGDAAKSLAAGDLAMFFSSTAYVGFVDRSKIGDWEFVTAPYPGINGAPQALPAGGNSSMLTSGSDDPEVLEAAWQFIKFATSGEGAAAVALTTGYVPPNKVANALLMEDFYTKNANKLTAVNQLPLLSEWFAYPGDNGLAVTQVIEDHLESIFVGDAHNMEELRDDLVEEVNALLPR
ncbi:sugar ABC transporter substrate-binding protein [Puniceibacterium antarcticum]|uniref:Sugar ABC transporter substrate-binding protein n=1 Tax=Puniceibacterium antarcticum TaxID=1206336 RepID=A0A2G8REZ1_9RHOB|nr:ABC transporter substrate-binding protein [Puniceibacterium antarcticum]PIL19648.1 sugar ABC transporter substrate-binding protein [Puniceibacterium antarcticum]